MWKDAALLLGRSQRLWAEQIIPQVWLRWSCLWFAHRDLLKNSPGSVIFLGLRSIAQAQHPQQDSCPFVWENPHWRPFQLNRALWCLCKLQRYDLTSVKNALRNTSQRYCDKSIPQTENQAHSRFKKGLFDISENTFICFLSHGRTRKSIHFSRMWSTLRRQVLSLRGERAMLFFGRVVFVMLANISRTGWSLIKLLERN